jgi:hypothetical protein
MRRFTNIVFVLGLLGTLGALVALRTMDQAKDTEIEAIAEDVRRFELMIKYQAATNEVELTGRGWPATVDPTWFGNEPPRIRCSRRIAPGCRSPARTKLTCCIRTSESPAIRASRCSGTTPTRA